MLLQLPPRSSNLAARHYRQHNTYTFISFHFLHLAKEPTEFDHWLDLPPDLPQLVGLPQRQPSGCRLNELGVNRRGGLPEHQGEFGSEFVIIVAATEQVQCPALALDDDAARLLLLRSEGVAIVSNTPVLSQEYTNTEDQSVRLQSPCVHTPFDTS